MTSKTNRLPRGFRVNPSSGGIVCRHRDCSCCQECAAAREEIVDVLGEHFWIADPAERSGLIAEMKASVAP